MVFRRRRDSFLGRWLRRVLALGVVVVVLGLAAPAILFLAPWKDGVPGPDGGQAVRGGYYSAEWRRDMLQLRRLVHRLKNALLRAPWEEAGAWFAIAPQPVPRAESAHAVVDGRWYIIGGHVFDAPASATTRVDMYDPATGVWSRMPGMPEAVTHIVAATDGPDIWIAGGFGGDDPGPPVAGVWRLDTRAGRWFEGPPLPAPVAGGALVRRGRLLHFFGGYSGGRETSPGWHWSLDLDDRPAGWTARSPLPESRGHLGGVSLLNRVYAIGGQRHHDIDPVDVALVQAWDPAADRWEAAAPLPRPLSHIEVSTLVHGGRILVLGGQDRGAGNTPMRRILAWRPGEERWQTVGYMAVGLIGGSAAVLGDRLCVTGGYDIAEAGTGQRTTVCTPLAALDAEVD